MAQPIEDTRMLKNRIASALALGALSLGLSASAQEAKKEARKEAPKKEATKDTGTSPKAGGKFASLEALNTYYSDQFKLLERMRLADLTKLAANLSGPEAEMAYQDIFNTAVARDHYEAAEKAADQYLGSAKTDPRTRALASFVGVIAAANRQEYGQSLERLARFLKASTTPAEAAKGQADPGAPQLDPATTFAVGEAFLQRLIRDGQYRTARRAADIFVKDSPDPEVKKHFGSRLERIDMLGKPAPEIKAEDLDGQPFDLADLKGKVVLIDFWATWAPPSVASIPHYNALAQQFKDKDFAIVGVNLDGMRDDLRRAGSGQIAHALRQYLVQARVSWPVILNGTGDKDIARAYGVTEIPATFLVDRSGKIAHVELSGAELDKAVAEAVGGPKEKAAGPAGEESKPSR